jgi:hypothetical protein
MANLRAKLSDDGEAYIGARASEKLSKKSCLQIICVNFINEQQHHVSAAWVSPLPMASWH